MQTSPVNAPAIETVPDGGELILGVSGGVVLIGMKRGGLIVSEPVWIKMGIWNALALFGNFIAGFAASQLQAALQQNNTKRIQ